MQSLVHAMGRHASGAAAVEFALVTPFFLILLFGTVVLGSYISIVNSIQQLAAEAARGSIAGLSETERASLAQSTINTHLSAYPLIDPAHLSIVSAATIPTTTVFAVTLRYDASAMFMFNMPFVPTPAKAIVRSASIQRGGY